MSTFHWQGDTYPMPDGWSGLSIEDWFYRLETVRDDLMHADEMDLPRMQDEDGDDLDPEEVVLISKYGFRSGGHWEAFRNWGVSSWAAHTGTNFTDCEFRMSGIARERIMADLGLRFDPGWQPDLGGVKASFGIDESVESLTYREIQDRRAKIRDNLQRRK